LLRLVPRPGAPGDGGEGTRGRPRLDLLRQHPLELLAPAVEVVLVHGWAQRRCCLSGRWPTLLPLPLLLGSVGVRVFGHAIRLPVPQRAMRRIRAHLESLDPWTTRRSPTTSTGWSRAWCRTGTPVRSSPSP